MSKDQESKPSPDSGGYGYNYGGYQTGYGYGEGGGQTVQRTLQDYLLILRERIWYIVLVFLVVFASALVYTLSAVKIYQSTATVQIFRHDPTIIQSQQVVDNDVRSAEDLNTQVKVLESERIVQRVADRLKGDELRAFLAPYDKSGADVSSVPGILGANRKIIPQRLTLVVAVSYQHPDRFIAAKIANYFVDEYMKHNSELKTFESRAAVDDLKATVDEQRKRVEQLAHELQAYKEQHNMPALDQRKDVVSEALKQSNTEVQRTQSALSEAETKYNQVKERQQVGRDPKDLPFIASDPLIAQLTQQLAANQIMVATLSKRYRPKYPEMVKAQDAVTETERQLKRAVDQACERVKSAYEGAKNNFDQATKEYNRRTTDSLALDSLAVAFDDKKRDLDTNEQILTSIIARTTDVSMTSNIQTQNARVVDVAQPAPEGQPEYPRVGLNLGLGFVGGLGLGLAFAFFVAFVDDRVKSSFDIEGVVGLPLIGIIPEIKRLDQADKAQIVFNNADRQVAEAFLTLHSSLRLKDESKNAKCILTTSTIPGEGKSFTTTNLALTFASHGERVAIVDCDLRKPNIHKSFKVENLRGVIDVCGGKATLDQVIVRNVQANLDIIPAGGRAKNPTQILNSKAFELMLSDLRKSYDRVFIDTPPLAAVSDALIILPLVDGSIFTIYFNKVRRKAAQFAAKRLLEANVPNFGAVLNGLNLAVSGYYYAQYYDKSYKDYYVVMSKDDGDAK